MLLIEMYRTMNSQVNYLNTNLSKKYNYRIIFLNSLEFNGIGDLQISYSLFIMGHLTSNPASSISVYYSQGPSLTSS